MNIRLEVPYNEKDSAKSKGARWNPDLKTWYVNDISLLRGVSRWLRECNIICENLYLLKMDHTCWKCRRDIEVVCLATDQSYASVNGKYIKNPNIQLLSYVHNMPKNLEDYLIRFDYKLSYSKTIKEVYFVNHCCHCHSIQGDNFLHERPEQAFYKKLLYPKSAPISYSRIKSSFCIPLTASLPFYDQVSSSIDMLSAHMETGIENRASLQVTQKLINGLFACSLKGADIELPDDKW